MSQLTIIALRLLPVIPKMLPVLTKEQGQLRVREVLGMLLERRPSRAKLVTPTGTRQPWQGTDFTTVFALSGLLIPSEVPSVHRDNMSQGGIC